MNRKVIKKYRWIEIAILVWTLVAVLAMTALAATTSPFSCFQLSAESSGDVKIEVTSNGWSIKAYGTDGSCGSTSTETVTFTISNTDTTRGVSFDISVTSSDASPSGAPSGSQTLAASGSMTKFTATSGAGSKAYTTINISITNIEQESVGATITTTIKPSIGGVIMVDGTEVTAQKDFTKLDTETYTLTATANSGYTFYGWMSSDGVLTTDGVASYTYAGKNAATLWPLFIKSDSAIYNIAGANPVLYYGYLDEAITAAGSSGTILLHQSGTVYHSNSTQSSFTIPSGVTFLMPYASGKTSFSTTTKTSGINSTLEYANTELRTNASEASVNPKTDIQTTAFLSNNPHLSLTIPSGTTVTVAKDGKWLIGGMLGAGAAGTSGLGGVTTNSYAKVNLEGTINVSNGGILSACGYITGGGKVNMESDATAYQPYTLVDHRDGWTFAQAKNAKVVPYYRYTMQNIQSDIHMVSGAKMKAYILLYTKPTSGLGEQYSTTCPVIIGGSSDTALIKMNSGATLDISYDPSTVAADDCCANGLTYNGYTIKGLYDRIGRTTLNFSGGATLGSLKLSISLPIFGAQEADSSNYFYPVPYNYNIVLDNGIYSIANKLMLLPGSRMTVNDKAELQVSSSLAVFDGFRDHQIDSRYQITPLTEAQYNDDGSGDLWPLSHYPKTAYLNSTGFGGSANLIVNGKLTVSSDASLGGKVQSTSATGIIEMNGTNSVTVQTGSNAEKILGNACVMNGASVRTLTAQLFASDGNIITMEAGKTYQVADTASHTQETYSYTLYTTGDAKTTVPQTRALNARLTGSWQCAEGFHIDAADEEGFGNHICDVCGYKTEHVDAIPEGETYADHNCDICGKVLSECSDSEDDEDILCDTCGKILCAHAEVTAIAEDPATCVTDGHKAYWQCTTCEFYYADEACTTEIPDLEAWLAGEGLIEALGHTYGEGVQTTAPTCQEDGVMTYTCTTEGCTEETQGHTKTEPIPATGHTPAEAVEEKRVEPTCGEAGSYESVVKCSVCGEEITRETVTIPATGNHTPGADATCTTAQTCTVCKAELKAALGHDMVTDAAVDATCTKPGLTEGKHCSRCDDATVAQEVVPAGHTIAQGAAQAKTCTQDGWAAYEYCTECDYTTKVVIPAGHTIAQGAAQEKTCTQDGWEAYEYCTECDYTTKVVIPAGHIIEQGAAQSKTCTQDGWEAYEYCTECDYTTKDVIPAGHTIAQGAAQAKTCTQDGWAAYEYCTECDYSTKEVIPAGHTIQQGEAQTKTCEQDGWAAYEYCTECDYSTKVVIPAGHTLTQVEAKTPTCTEAGHEAYEECSVCDYTTYKEIAATQHNIVIDEAVAPTCTTTGLTKGEHCTKCDYKVAQVVVPATNHANKVPGEAKDATCTETGNTAGEYCPDCETWIVAQETIPVLDHKFTAYEGNDEIKTAVCDYNCGATDVKIENADSDTAVDITPDTTDSDKVNAEVGKEQLDKVVEEKLDIQMNTGILELIFESEAVQDIVDGLEAKDKVTINVENATPEDATNSVRFDIYLAVNGTKKDSTEFSGEYVTVTIDLAQLEATLGDPTKDVEIWYVDENGDRIEKMEHQKDGTKVKFKTNHFSYYEVVVEDDVQSVTVTIDNKAEGVANVTAPTTGTVGGAYTITVAAEKACVVLTKDAEGNYERLTAEPVADHSNTYSFAATLENGMTFVVAVKGDISLDNTVDGVDAARAALYFAQKIQLDALNVAVGDLDGDNVITGVEAARAALAFAQKITIAW